MWLMMPQLLKLPLLEMPKGQRQRSGSRVGVSVAFGRRRLFNIQVQAVLLELIVDPACSIAFEAEPEGADVMNRPPSNLDKPLFADTRLASALL